MHITDNSISLCSPEPHWFLLSINVVRMYASCNRGEFLFVLLLRLGLVAFIQVRVGGFVVSTRMLVPERTARTGTGRLSASYYTQPKMLQMHIIGLYVLIPEAYRLHSILLVSWAWQTCTAGHSGTCSAVPRKNRSTVPRTTYYCLHAIFRNAGQVG